MKMLYSAESRQTLQVVRHGGNFACISESAWIDLVDSVLVFINQDEARACGYLTPKSIISDHDGSIADKYMTEELLEFALSNICDSEGKLNASKVAKCVAIMILLRRDA